MAESHYGQLQPQHRNNPFFWIAYAIRFSTWLLLSNVLRGPYKSEPSLRQPFHPTRFMKYEFLDYMMLAWDHVKLGLHYLIAGVVE
jgi:hypothetical protein